MTSKLAPIVANMAENHFKDSFRNQGFTDYGLSRWRNVKRRIPGTRAYKYSTPAGRTAPILRGKGSGRLAKSIKATEANSRRIRIQTVGAQVNKYADVHNEGLSAGRSGFKMPRRQFMGKSKQLDKKIMGRINQEVKRVLTLV